MIQSADFSISVSASDFVAWVGNGKTDYIGNPFLVQALSLLSIPIDPSAFYREYFDSNEVGSGGVLFYRSTQNGESICAVDLYRDIHDQLDIVTFGIRTAKNAAGVRVVLRSFFDSAEYQIRYEEGGVLSSVATLIDRRAYPRKLPQNGYMQCLVVKHDD